MKTISIAEAKQYFDALAIQPSHEPISVTDQQKEIAVIVSPEDFYRLLQIAKQCADSAKPKTLLDFLGAGKTHSRFSSVEEIDAFIAGNREIWNN